MSTRHFCTFFDANYLSKALLQLASMRREIGDFTLCILCLDEAVHAYFAERPDPRILLLRLSELEAADPALLAVKAGRSRVEYYFTLTASFMRQQLRSRPEVDILLYIDAEIYFYRDAEPIFEEFGDGSILIAGHRFAEEARGSERNGIYNAGFLGFRNDARGLACLERWRELCLEWCYDVVEPERYANQKYLDHWPADFPGTRVLEGKGVGLAPWNLLRYRIEQREGRLFVDGDPLVFYHFHNFSFVSPRVVQPGLRFYWDRPMSSAARRFLFEPYAREMDFLLRTDPAARRCTTRYDSGSTKPFLALVCENEKLVRVGQSFWRVDLSYFPRHTRWTFKKIRNIARKVGRDLASIFRPRKRADSTRS